MAKKIDELWDPWTGDELAQATESVHETYVALQRARKQEETPKIHGNPKDSEVEPDGASSYGTHDR